MIVENLISFHCSKRMNQQYHPYGILMDYPLKK